MPAQVRHGDDAVMPSARLLYVPKVPTHHGGESSPGKVWYLCSLLVAARLFQSQDGSTTTFTTST